MLRKNFVRRKFIWAACFAPPRPPPFYLVIENVQRMKEKIIFRYDCCLFKLLSELSRSGNNLDPASGFSNPLCVASVPIRATISSD